MGETMERYKAIIQQVVEAQSAQLVAIEVDTSMQPKVLRILVDTPQGVRIDQCVDINKALCEVLPLDVLPGEYVIEVASPGAERELPSLAHIEQAIGKYVYLRLHKPVDKQTELLGTLVHLGEQDGETILTIKRQQLHHIRYQNIAFIRTAVHI